MENMFSLLEVKSTIQNVNEKIPESQIAEIKFDQVSFDYDVRRTIIKNISFVVPNGKKVAIVGPTGAGKSTISRLLFKFYEPKSGGIFINNSNINNISQESLREMIGVVPQDTVLFNDTIHYNISYGNPLANEEEVIHAAKNAETGIYELVLPPQVNSTEAERDGWEWKVIENERDRNIQESIVIPSNLEAGKAHLGSHRNSLGISRDTW